MKFLEKIFCPECGKEITEQAEVELETSAETTVSTKTSSSKEMFPAHLIFKNGEYFLILEATCVCPYCENTFAMDVPLRLADMGKFKEARAHAEHKDLRGHG